MTSKKSKRTKNFELDINIKSQNIDQQRKKIHHKDLIQFQPLTPTQYRLFETFTTYKDKQLALIGSAGTGKTFCAFFLALDELLQFESYDKIIIVRSTVPTRDCGFLPGDLDEKSQVYELPYYGICDELFKFSKSYDTLKRLNKVEFMTSAFLRGTTFNNCLIIVDECQNFSWEELYTVTTRVGHNSRIIFCGDTKQDDLHYIKYDRSGFARFKSIIESMESFEILNFTADDIVRSSFVKEFIIKSESV